MFRVKAGPAQDTTKISGGTGIDCPICTRYLLRCQCCVTTQLMPLRRPAVGSVTGLWPQLLSFWIHPQVNEATLRSLTTVGVLTQACFCGTWGFFPNVFGAKTPHRVGPDFLRPVLQLRLSLVNPSPFLPWRSHLCLSL